MCTLCRINFQILRRMTHKNVNVLCESREGRRGDFYVFLKREKCRANLFNTQGISCLLKGGRKELSEMRHVSNKKEVGGDDVDGLVMS
jgi:hypothetical protein